MTHTQTFVVFHAYPNLIKCHVTQQKVNEKVGGSVRYISFNLSYSDFTKLFYANNLL